MEIEIDTTGYNNDLTYSTRDAALTMFVHLGYLAFNQDRKTVRIPNEEIRLEFERTIRSTHNEETMKRVRESDRLIMDTVHGDAGRWPPRSGRSTWKPRIPSTRTGRIPCGP